MPETSNTKRIKGKSQYKFIDFHVSQFTKERQKIVQR